jgi:hypothetical protein
MTRHIFDADCKAVSSDFRSSTTLLSLHFPSGSKKVREGMLGHRGYGAVAESSRSPLPTALLRLKVCAEVIGLALPIINSLCNLILVFLLLTMGGARLKVFTIAHTVVVSLAVLVIDGMWVGHGRDTTGVPRWYRRAPGALIYILSLPIYFLTPILAAWVRTTSTFEIQEYIDLPRKQQRTGTRVLREEEESIRRELKLANWLNALDTIVRDSQLTQLVQLGVEGVPLMITQLVMMVTGVLSVGSPVEESHLEPIRVLCYVSMCTVFLHLAFRGYMVCRSYDLQVFAIRWLFVLFDLTSMLYLLVFITTVGKPFASFEALLHREFRGGCALSQVWMVGYLSVLCCMSILMMIMFALIVNRRSGCHPDTFAVVGLAIALVLPFAFTLLGLKLSLINWGLVLSEPYNMSAKEVSREGILFFGFLRRASGEYDWNNRVQHICRFLHRVITAGKIQPHYNDMLEIMQSRWEGLYGPEWQFYPQAPAAPGESDTGQRRKKRLEFRPRYPWYSPSRRQRLSWNPNEILMLSIAILFTFFQFGFTFWFPFIAAGLYWEQQTPLLKGLFGLSVALLVLMVPMIPRLRLYFRFWFHLKPLLEISTSCGLFFYHGGTKDETGAEIPMVDAAIQDFYTPSHERAVVWALRSACATVTSIPAPSPVPDNGSPVLLPFDVVHRLSTFSSSSHIQMSELTRREAQEINGVVGDCSDESDDDDACRDWSSDPSEGRSELTPLMLEH